MHTSHQSEILHSLIFSVFLYLGQSWSVVSNYLLYYELLSWKYGLPLVHILSDHVTSGKAGWTQDYLLHPMQKNFSGMDGVQPPLGTVRLKVKIKGIGPF